MKSKTQLHLNILTNDFQHILFPALVSQEILLAKDLEEEARASMCGDELMSSTSK